MTCSSKCKIKCNVPSEIQVAKTGDETPQFNPNACKYRTCCCHVKCMSLVIGIIQLVILGWMIICLSQFLVKIKQNRIGRYNHEADTHHEKHHENQHYHKHHDHHDHRYHHKWIHKLYDERYYHRFLFKLLWCALVIVTMRGVFLGLLLYGIYKQTWGYLVPHLLWQGLTIVVGIASLVTAFVLMGGHGGIQTYKKIFNKPVGWGLVWLAIDAYFFHVVCSCTKYFRARAEAMRSSDVTGIGVMPVTGMKYMVQQGNTDLCANDYYGMSTARDPGASDVSPPPEYEETPPTGFQVSPLPLKPISPSEYKSD